MSNENEGHATQSETIGKVASILAQDWFSTGDRAELRRMRIGQTPPPTFWRVLANVGKHFADSGHSSDTFDRDVRRWQRVVKGMAIMSPNHHDPKVAVGSALKEINYSEQRLARLLKSRGQEFESQYLRMVRQLANSRRSLNWYELARIVFAHGISEEWAEEYRLRIAKNYYYQKEK